MKFILSCPQVKLHNKIHKIARRIAQQNAKRVAQ